MGNTKEDEIVRDENSSGDAIEVADQAEPAEPEEAVEIDLDQITPKVEAALLTNERAMTSGKIAEALGLDFPGASKPVNAAIARLNGEYEETGRAFRIEQVAGGWQVMTLPEHADVLAALHKTKAQSKLSPAAMETLAIVAYKQPVLRAELEAIRGVACGETLRSLMERHLVKIVGRAEEIGRPMLYGTTKQFLEVFGLASLKDLPEVEEFRGGKP
ncbi:MAG: SMC-Scp complex subunit ScpB [Planctomycetota bacterium]